MNLFGVKTYSSNHVKRVYIPKSNGGQRLLGIPTIRDRVTQTAALLVIEPIFEADFWIIHLDFEQIAQHMMHWKRLKGT